MDLKQLNNFLKDEMPASSAYKTLDRISHWMEKLKFEKIYTTNIQTEVLALKKLESLGLIKLKGKGTTVEAGLTADGEDIHKEMIARGFYLKKGKI